MEDFNLDNDAIMGDDLLEGFTPVEKEQPAVEKKTVKKRKKVEDEEPLVSCLRNELVRVVLIKKHDSKATTKGHPYEGGIADGSRWSFTLPTLRDGKTYVDPLTKSEKAYLEDYMGLEENALSIYNTNDNFWDNRQVILDKEGIVLNLANPNDYISYKILCANKDKIALSPKAYREKPLETQRFMLVTEQQKASDAKEKSSEKSIAWKAYLELEDNADALRCIIETLDGRRVDSKTDIDFLRERTQEFIEDNPSLFVRTATDPLLSAKILIKKAVDGGVINRSGDFYYYEGKPLCEKDTDPTFSIAAAYIASKKNQEIKFSIEQRLK